MKIIDILKDSNYKLTQFETSQIEALENSIISKEVRGKQTPYVECLVRKREMKLTPEEIVRQLYLMVLNQKYGYDFERMAVEYNINLGSTKKRADIVIFDKKNTTAVYILVELKKPRLQDGKEQLKSYCHGTGAPMGVWTNGESISFYNRRDPNYFKDIPNIPNSNQTLKELLSEKWTINDLIRDDKLVAERKSLKDLIKEILTVSLD